MRREVIAVLALIFSMLAAPAHAELDKTLLKSGEQKLKTAFEGTHVAISMDMPATSQGVDVIVGAPQPLDLADYSSRIKKYGVSVKSGARVMVTKVKVNPRFIEFQLAGGGYGTFGDDSSPDVGVPSAEKTRREKDIENWLRGEPSAERRRELQRELDDLRKARAREDAANRATAAAATETQRALISEKRLSGGSRFNVRYANGVPEAALEPQGLRAALARWVTFEGDASSSGAGAAAAGGGPAGLRKGMSIDEVESMLGRPESLATAMLDGMKKTTCAYAGKDGTVDAVFIEGVLVRYSIRSN